jgi:phage-related protein
MGAILALIGRILAILPLSLSSLIGIIQTVIKLIKEIITLIVNLLFPLFPDGGKFEKTVLKIRSIVDKFDAMWEVVKKLLLSVAGATTPK